MNWQAILNVFAMIFVTMGPIKVLIVYAEESGSLESAVRRRIAIKSVTIASVVGLVELWIQYGNSIILSDKTGRHDCA